MKLPFAFAPKTTEGRYLSVTFILFLLFAAMTFMVWKYPDMAGLVDGNQQQIYWLIGGGCISGCTFIMLVVLLWQALSAGKKEFDVLVNETSGDDEKTKRENDNVPVHPAVVMCDRIRAHLRSRISLYWRSKTRLLLITGDEAAIEQLVRRGKQPPDTRPGESGADTKTQRIGKLCPQQRPACTAGEAGL